MAMEPFLAMTAAEIRNISALPGKIAWMACHFSPYGTGLSNLPQALPIGSMLIVDDMTPPHGHDPAYIGEQLIRCVERCRYSGVLLDFQRPGCMETRDIAEYLINTLPCPAVVSEAYARDLACPVFLPPVPLSVAPETYLKPWKGREIWLELGLDGELLTLTELGCNREVLPCPCMDAEGFAEETLHCHYAVEVNEKAARFTLWRTKDDLDALIKEAESLGIGNILGLYQELR